MKFCFSVMDRWFRDFFLRFSLVALIEWGSLVLVILIIFMHCG